MNNTYEYDHSLAKQIVLLNKVMGDVTLLHRLVSRRYSVRNPFTEVMSSESVYILLPVSDKNDRHIEIMPYFRFRFRPFHCHRNSFALASAYQMLSKLDDVDRAVTSY